jgi:hypothetical protein
MSEDVLCRYSARLSADDRGSVLDGQLPHGVEGMPVLRENGSTIPTAVVDSLMAECQRRRDDGAWSSDRTEVDRWLAPRIHYALRLTRQRASDRSLWEWLAMRYHEHTVWRWADPLTNVVGDDRYFGPIHKQVIARLWWGAEIFRNGPDYVPVERAFVRQDLINSYLHRPLVRCRSLALGIVDVLIPPGEAKEKSAAQVNDLARVLNFATAGAPPELETELQQDDFSALEMWAAKDPDLPPTWDAPISGPPCGDTTEGSLIGGRRIAERGWEFTGHAA